MQLNYDIEKLVPLITRVAKDTPYILEIGPAKGDGSTVAFENACNEKHFDNRLYLTVDIRDYMERKPTLPYWDLIIGDSLDYNTVLDVWYRSGRRKADLIFIDTVHTYEQLKEELYLWSSLSHEKTVWLFHDTWMMGEYNVMTDAIKEFATENHLFYMDLSKDSHGLGFAGKL